MKNILILIISAFCVTNLNAQLFIDTISTDKGIKIIKNEIGFNYQSFAAVLLGGSPTDLNLNLHYKKLLKNGNALRLNTNYQREQNLNYYPFQSQSILVDGISKTELKLNQNGHMFWLGFGYEYRKPTNHNVTFYCSADAMIAYKYETKDYNISTSKTTGDSIPYLGSSFLKIPEYQTNFVDPIEKQTTHSLGLGAQFGVGILWGVTERFSISTGSVARGLIFNKQMESTNIITNETSKSASSNFDLTSSLIGDFSLYFRF